MNAISCHESNYKAGRTEPIRYLVIHYVGAEGGAKANAHYYGTTPNIGASAHYFVGHASEKAVVYQSVKETDTAWHCGTSGTYRHKTCRNANSVGIEMCCHKNSSGGWYFDEATVNAAVALASEIVKRHGIPESNILRHYDVTGKICPAPFVANAAAWAAFKKKVFAAGVSTTASVAPSSGLYLVRVTASALNIRKDPGTSYPVVGSIHKGEVYTIVEETSGAGASSWGRLKSGAGWIALDYVKRI